MKYITRHNQLRVGSRYCKIRPANGVFEIVELGPTTLRYKTIKKGLTLDFPDGLWDLNQNNYPWIECWTVEDIKKCISS